MVKFSLSKLFGMDDALNGVLFVTAFCAGWDTVVNFFLRYFGYGNLIFNNLYIWFATDVLLFSSLFFVVKREKHMDICLLIVLIVICHASGCLAMIAQNLFLQVFGIIIAAGGYFTAIYLLNFNGLINENVESSKWTYMQMMAGVCYGLIAFYCISMENCTTQLDMLFVIFLMALSFLYKYIYVGTVRAQLEKPVILSPNQRKWHGKVVEISSIADQFYSWKRLWTSFRKTYKQNWDHYTCLLDPLLTQHIGYAVNGIYAVRICETLDVDNIQNEDNNTGGVTRGSALTELKLQTGQYVDAIFAFGKNERDSLDASRIEKFQGYVFCEYNSYWFMPKDKTNKCIWKNKCRPGVVHAIIVESRTVPGKIDIPEHDPFKGEYLQIEVFENFLLKDRPSMLMNTILDSRYIVVLKKINTKVKAKRIIKHFVTVAKEQLRRCRPCAENPYGKNLKKVMALDWCKVEEFPRLQASFLNGSLNSGLRNRCNMKNINFFFNANVVVIDGSASHLSQILCQDGQCEDANRLRQFYNFIEIPNLTVSSSQTLPQSYQTSDEQFI